MSHKCDGQRAMLYLKPLACCGSPNALKRPNRSKQCHCTQFAQSDIDNFSNFFFKPALNFIHLSNI